MTDNNATLSFRSALISLRQLHASGVKNLVASPGLRNSPLILAARQTPGLNVLTAIDERAGAFLALGICRALREPTAVVCTSGTAVANYLPAVLEANHSQLPLVVLTADRPAELIGTGANQCTDQTKIFGSHVRFAVEVGPVMAAATSLEQAGYAVARAVAKAKAPYPGPVHVNLRFREPFLPEAGAFPDDARPVTQPWTFLQAVSAPTQDQVEAVKALLEGAERPLLIVGPSQFSKSDSKLLAYFSDQLRIPLLCEAASGLACQGRDTSFYTLQRLELILEKMLGGFLPAPDLILRFGEPVTGRALGRLLNKHPVPQLVFEDWGEAREPNLHPSIFLEGGFSLWLAALSQLPLQVNREWADNLLAAETALEKSLVQHLDRCEALTEWHFHRKLGELAGENAALFLGNSMPIRDFNSVFPRYPKYLNLFCNRGLSGIDGLIATATGVAYGSQLETHAVIGDLSALHDANSLSLVNALREDINLTLWVMNNRGGEIFRIVPTAKADGQPEWFTTPQDYDLSALAKTFRISYARLHSRRDLDDLPPETFQKGVRLIEVVVDPETNLQTRKTFPG